MITRFAIDGYKSLVGFSADVGQIAVVFGPNAAGKSNILDALQLFRGFVTERTLARAFEPPHRGQILESCHYGREGLDGIREKGEAFLRFEIDIQLSDLTVEEVRRRCEALRKPHENGSRLFEPRKKGWVFERLLRYELRVRVDAKTAGLSVVDESLTALGRGGQPKSSSRKPFVSTEPGTKSQRRLVLRLEGQSHPQYLDSGLDHTLVSTELYAPHYPHIVAFREEVSRWRFYYLEPKRLMRDEVPLADVRFIEPTGSRLAAFYHVLKSKTPNQFRAIELALRSIVPQIQGINTRLDDVGNVELRVMENGVPYSGRLISEGTLRILGVLAAINARDPATLIGYEEPENGIHPDRIELLAMLLKNVAEERGLQLIINTQSPIFPKAFEPGQLFKCERRGTATRLTSLEEAPPLFKDNEIRQGLADGVSIP